MYTTLEATVCDKNDSKKMKEVGFLQDSIFYWTWNDNDTSILTCPHFVGMMEDKNNASAYTIMELLSMLPATIFISKYNEDFRLSVTKRPEKNKLTKEWHACYRSMKYPDLTMYEEQGRVNDLSRVLARIACCLKRDGKIL